MNGQEMEVKDSFNYLEDTLNSKGDNLAMIDERIKSSAGSTAELISL